MNTRSGQLASVIATCLEFCSDPKQKASIYLHGPVGCGKTLLAVKMLLRTVLMLAPDAESEDWAWPFEPQRIQISSVPALLAEIRATFDGNGSSTDVVGYYSTLHWLALDDLGAEKPSDWVCDILFQIIDERYGALRPTIFTSNLSLGELSDRLSERIADRILEMCSGHIIEIKLGSYRS